MTGEITLRGEVLPIGGLKEKLLAAHRGGIKTVLIPEENVKDLAEIPDNDQEPARDRAGALDRPGARASRSSASRRRSSTTRQADVGAADAGADDKSAVIKH